MKLTSSPGGNEWTPRFDLLGSGRDDRDFVVEIDNEGRANLRFGDDECGRAPEAETRFSALYRIGNGKVGNVGGEAIHHLVYRRHKPDGIDGARNPLPADGGSDPEPINEVKLFAPSAFRKELQRAITPEDYAHLAKTKHDSKVQRAAAVLCWTGSWHEMQVAIDPLGSEILSDDLRLEIERDLYRFRRIGYDLRIMPARYVSLDIAMDVCVQPDYLHGHVKAALLRAFSNRILPDGKPGFFHPDQLTFGDGVYLSQLVAVAQAVDGVESVSLTKLQRQFERPNHELENGVLPLGPLEVARCNNDPSFPEHGQFELNVMGGR
jgi:predicted phage baseplate assembly protein